MTNHTSRYNTLVTTPSNLLANLKANGAVSALAIVLIILVGALLRLEHVTQPFVDKFSWREASTAMMAQNFYRGQWNILYPEVDWGGPGPNYQGREFQIVTYLAAVLYNVFGQHEWVGRFVSILFGLWGIFALYKLVRRVWDDQRALVSAAFLSVIPGSVFIDRSFLPDSAMAALVITSLWMLVAYCQTEKISYLVLSALVGCLGILTKLPGIIVGLPAAYAIYAILGRRVLQAHKLLTLIAAAVSVLMVTSAYYLWARYLSMTYPPYHFAGSSKIISLDKVSDWIRHYYYVPSLLHQVFAWLWTWPVAILVLIGLFFPPYRQEEGQAGPKGAPWFFHWFGVAIVVGYLIEAQHLVEDPNNMSLWNPFAAAIGGNAIVSGSVLIRAPARTIAITIIIVIVGLVGRNELRPRYNPTYAHSYYIGEKVRQIANPDDLVISFGLNPCTIYYSKLHGWLFPPTEIWHSTSLGWDYGELDIKALKWLWERGAKWLAISNSSDDYIDANKLKRQERSKKLWTYIHDNFELYDESEDGMIFRLPGKSTPNLRPVQQLDLHVPSQET